MKKLVLLFAIHGFLLTSCKKEQTCTCISVTDFNGATAESITTAQVIRNTKKKAKKECEKGSGTSVFSVDPSLGNYTTTNTVTCVLD
jgi:hypothetical protein